MSKQVSNSTHISVHVLILLPGRFTKLGLHSLNDLVALSEACLYSHIHWSLAQAQQQFTMGLSQYFPSVRGGKFRPMTGLHFNVQKRPVPESSGASLAKRPHLERGLRLIQVVRNLLVVVSLPVLLILERRLPWGSQCS